jgi:hypothetical protein
LTLDLAPDLFSGFPAEPDTSSFSLSFPVYENLPLARVLLNLNSHIASSLCEMARSGWDRILLVSAHDFFNDPVHIDGGERLDLMPLKKSVKLRSPNQNLAPDSCGGKWIARRTYP